MFRVKNDIKKENESDTTKIEEYIKKNYSKSEGIRQEELDEFENRGVLRFVNMHFEKTNNPNILKKTLKNTRRIKL